MTETTELTPKAPADVVQNGVKAKASKRKWVPLQIDFQKYDRKRKMWPRSGRLDAQPHQTSPADAPSAATVTASSQETAAAPSWRNNTRKHVRRGGHQERGRGKGRHGGENRDNSDGGDTDRGKDGNEEAASSTSGKTQQDNIHRARGGYRGGRRGKKSGRRQLFDNTEPEGTPEYYVNYDICQTQEQIMYYNENMGYFVDYDINQNHEQAMWTGYNTLFGETYYQEDTGDYVDYGINQNHEQNMWSLDPTFSEETYHGENMYFSQFGSVEGEMPYVVCCNGVFGETMIYQDMVEKIRSQMEYYFSGENLAKDLYLRRHMSREGWVDYSFVAGFPRVQMMTSDHNLVLQAIKCSSCLELSEDSNQVRTLIRPDLWPILGPASSSFSQLTIDASESMSSQAYA